MRIGVYEIERELGRGGFGVVHVGVDTRLGRKAAIKQLLPELSGNKEIVERFFNEAKAAASINHPGIVEIYDVGWHTDGSAYFAMKLLDGQSLAARLRTTGPLPIDIVATLGRQVAAALAAAHARQIVHRDLKPDNIILVPEPEVAIGERAIILDFGIAKLGGQDRESSNTRTGALMGTPIYMSPEQCRGAGEVDHRTDVYAFGIILFEMLAGHPPFRATSFGELVGMHQFVEPPALRDLRTDVPEALSGIVMRCLAKSPADRPAEAEILAALQSTSRGSIRLTGPNQASDQQVAPTSPSIAASHPAIDMPATRSSRKWLLVGGALIAVAAVVLFAATRDSTDPPPREPLAGTAPIDVATPIDIASTVPSPDATANARYVEEQLTVEATKLIAERDWAGLQKAADRLLALEPDNQTGKQLRDQATRETTAAQTFAALTDAVNANDPPRARASLDSIKPDSVYRKQAAAAYDKLVATRIAAFTTKGQALIAAHKCEDLEKFARAESKLVPAVKAAYDRMNCAGAPTGAPDTAMLEEARDAAKASQFGKSLRLAEEYLRNDPSSSDAHTIAAVAACNLKNAAAARKHMKALPEQRHQMVRQICLRNNVSTED